MRLVTGLIAVWVYDGANEHGSAIGQPHERVDMDADASTVAARRARAGARDKRPKFSR